jgi:hypothetical protein
MEERTENMWAILAKAPSSSPPRFKFNSFICVFIYLFVIVILYISGLPTTLS